MLRLSFPVLASFALLLSTGCAAQVRGNAGACTCAVPATVAGGYASGGASTAGWSGGSATGATTAGWNGTPTAGWNGSGTTGAGWNGSGSSGAGWNGSTGAGWNGTQTASWNGSTGGVATAGGRAEGGATATAGGPAFYGIPLAGAQDVVFVLDHSGSMSSVDQGAVGLPGSPLAALAVGMQAMQTVRLTAGTGLTLVPGALPFGSVPLAPSKMQTAKSELIGALAALPEGTRFNLVFFNDLVSAQSPGLMVMNPATRLQTVAFVQGVGASGETAAVPALRTAYTSAPTRVVFLSDGLANRGGSSQQLLAEARLQMRRGVRFDTVGVGPDQDGPLMQSLASESGGVAVRR